MRLKDVGPRRARRQEPGHQQPRSTASRTVGLAIFQLPDANALETADRVKAKMDELKQDFPEGVDYEIGYDTTPFIRESIDEVFKTLRDAIILVAIVVLVFLQNWRAAHHPAGRRAGRHRRHLRRHGRARLQPEQPDAVRAGAGDRHRRR